MIYVITHVQDNSSSSILKFLESFTIENFIVAVVSPLEYIRVQQVETLRKGVCKSRNPTRNTRNPPGTPGTPPGTLPGTPGTPPGTPGTPPGTPGTLLGTPGTLLGTPGTPPGTPGTPPGTGWNTSYEATHVFLCKFTCFALNSG